MGQIDQIFIPTPVGINLIRIAARKTLIGFPALRRSAHLRTDQGDLLPVQQIIYIHLPIHIHPPT